VQVTWQFMPAGHSIALGQALSSEQEITHLPLLQPPVQTSGQAALLGSGCSPHGIAIGPLVVAVPPPPCCPLLDSELLVVGLLVEVCSSLLEPKLSPQAEAAKARTQAPTTTAPNAPRNVFIITSLSSSHL